MIRTRSDMTVDLVSFCGSDQAAVDAARVSVTGVKRAATEEELVGLITYLLKSKHHSPFEHTFFKFFVEAPIFVFREWMRHRVGTSFNECSARYREMEPVFYVPDINRKLCQEGKPGHYTLVAGDQELYSIMKVKTINSYVAAYQNYCDMLKIGVAREVARSVLPVGTYSSMYFSCNARSLMHFLSLRTDRDYATFPSHPQREIEMCAEKMESHFAELMPITHKIWDETGRLG